MANIKSAKKRISVIEVKTQRNKRVKNHIREILKGFYEAVATGNKEEARDRLALAEKKLLQAGAKGTIHKNAAVRKVSRITKLFVKTFGAEALLIKAKPPVIATPEEKASRKAEREAARAAAHEKKHRAPKSKPKVEDEPPAEPAEEVLDVSEDVDIEIVANEKDADVEDEETAEEDSAVESDNDSEETDAKAEEIPGEIADDDPKSDAEVATDEIEAESDDAPEKPEEA